MKSSLIAVFTFLSMTTAAHADVISSACLTLSSAVHEFQSEYDQALFAVQNANVICSDDINMASCQIDLNKKLQEASDNLEQAKANYQEAGCRGANPF